MIALSKAWTTFGRFLFENGSAQRMAAFRILFASCMMVAQLSVVADVRLFYSSDGIVTNEELSNAQIDSYWSILHQFDSPSIVRVLHCLWIATALAVAVGWHTRSAAVLLFILTVSFRHRNPLVVNSGDQIASIVCFWLMFADSGYAWSRDAKRAPRSNPWKGTWVLRCLQLQLALMYGGSFLQKLTDPDWRSGTAMFYVVANEYLWVFPLTSMLDYPVLYKGLTYATLLFEGLFTFAICRRWTRRLFVALGMMFHLGIFIMLGLPFFSLYAISLLTLFTSIEQLPQRIIGRRK